jgi:excisionase family DNA binding protein
MAAEIAEVLERLQELEETVATLQPGRLLTVPEAANDLRLAVSSVWAMVKSGELESIVIGQKSRRIERAALDAYVAGCRSKGRR